MSLEERVGVYASKKGVLGGPCRWEGGTETGWVVSQGGRDESWRQLVSYLVAI